MITIDNERNMYDLFIENDMITTKELLGLGFNNNDLTTLINDGKIKRVKRGFYELDYNGGLTIYSKILVEQGKNNCDDIIRRLKKCAEVCPGNKNIKRDLFLKTLFNNRVDEALTYLDSLYNIDGEVYKQDYNLWLYLFSYVTKLPEKFYNEVCDMDINSVLCLDDNTYGDKKLQNAIRNLIMENKINRALTLMVDTPEYKNRDVNALITVHLLNAVRKYDYQEVKELYELVEQEKYLDIESLLDEERKLHKLSTNKEIIYTMVKDLRNIIENKKKPKVSNKHSKATKFSTAIFEHDYKTALELFDNSDSNQIIDSTGKLLEKVIEEIKKLEVEKGKEEIAKKMSANSFSVFTSHLMRRDIGMAVEELDKYLNLIGGSCYKGLIINLIKFGLLEKDMSFTNAMYELSCIKDMNYQFDPSIYIYSFYRNLVAKDFKKAAVFLDIVSMSGDIGGVCIDTTDMKNELVRWMEKYGASEKDLDISLPQVKSPPVDVKPVKREFNLDVINENIDKYYSIPDIVENVLNGDNVVMLEPMEDEEINNIIGMIEHVPNLQTIVIEEKNNDKRVVLRYVNRKDGFINFGDILHQANNNYRIGMYEEAIDQYETLLTNTYYPRNFLYAKLGLCYYKTTYDNNFSNAIDYLTLAMTQRIGDDKEYDFTELIEKLKRKCGYNGLKVDGSTFSDGADERITQYNKTNKD